MGAYNRRWYGLSCVLGFAGVGLLATSLGLDSIISMNLNRPNANDVIVASTRFFLTHSFPTQLFNFFSKHLNKMRNFFQENWILYWYGPVGFSHCSWNDFKMACFMHRLVKRNNFLNYKNINCLTHYSESLNCDREEMQLEDENLYSRMCECSVENGEVTMTALYSEALWWVTIAVIILACLSGLYASVFAGFNAVAKPTKEYMRWAPNHS